LLQAETDKFISIVIGFRNREISRVKNCLDSLAQQRYTDFELILLDYGSDAQIAAGVKELTLHYQFVRYLYSNTKGWFWNRGHALNSAMKFATGEIIVISDVDLIFPADNLDMVANLSFDNTFYTFTSYYLPERNTYPNIPKEEISTFENYYVGLCAVLRKHVQNVNGFNEYYMKWGCEDDDFYLRLENTGLGRIQVEKEKFPVYHQWHPKHNFSHPTAWYLDMVNYLYLRNPNRRIYKEYGFMVPDEYRSVLKRLQLKQCFKQLHLFHSPLFQFNVFLDDFFKMVPGEFGRFDFIINEPVVLPKGRKQKVIDKINKMLKKWDFPYTIDKEKIIVQEVHNVEIWNEFVTYFVGKNRRLIKDYVLMDSEGTLTFYFQKADGSESL